MNKPKPGDEVWLIHEVGPAKSMYRATVWKVGAKHIKVRREGCGVCALQFLTGNYPVFERVPANLKPAYRLELRNDKK